MWNTFYVRIEQIQGIYCKADSFVHIKYDFPSGTDAPDLNINDDDESRMPESSAEDGSFDNYINSMFIDVFAL